MSVCFASWRRLCCCCCISAYIFSIPICLFYWCVKQVAYNGLGYIAERNRIIGGLLVSVAVFSGLTAVRKAVAAVHERAFRSGDLECFIASHKLSSSYVVKDTQSWSIVLGGRDGNLYKRNTGTGGWTDANAIFAIHVDDDFVSSMCGGLLINSTVQFFQLFYDRYTLQKSEESSYLLYSRG